MLCHWDKTIFQKGKIDMEKQKEIIKPVEEEELEQTTGGVDFPPVPPEVTDQQPTNFPPMADIRFI